MEIIRKVSPHLKERKGRSLPPLVTHPSLMTHPLYISQRSKEANCAADSMVHMKNKQEGEVKLFNNIYNSTHELEKSTSSSSATITGSTKETATNSSSDSSSYEETTSLVENSYKETVSVASIASRSRDSLAKLSSCKETELNCLQSFANSCNRKRKSVSRELGPVKKKLCFLAPSESNSGQSHKRTSKKGRQVSTKNRKKVHIVHLFVIVYVQ